jgi:hypothetical protein
MSTGATAPLRIIKVRLKGLEIGTRNVALPAVEDPRTVSFFVVRNRSRGRGGKEGARSRNEAPTRMALSASDISLRN